MKKKFFTKQRAALILTLAMAVSIIGGMFAASSSPTFSDVPATHWAYAYVEEAADNGWVNGIGNGLFGVDNQVTYAELCTILGRAFYPDMLEYYGPTEYLWYEPYYHGVINYGFDQGTKIEGNEADAMEWLANRYDMAQMIYNILKREDVSFNYNAASVQDGIGDWASVPSNYREALTGVVGTGLITGVDDRGTFNGNGYMTRGQAAIVMCRMAELLGTGAVTTPAGPTTPTNPTTPETTTPGTSTGLGQKLSSGATAAAGVVSSAGKNDAYPTYGNSDVVSNNGYYTGATNVDIGNAQLVYEFLDMVNEVRVAEGHEPLAWVSGDAAEEHTLQRCYELVSNYSHDRPKGKYAAEVLAWGYTTVQQAFDGWMNSPAHKRTLMRDNISYMSAARAYGNGMNYWIICVWNEWDIESAETWSTENYDKSSLFD